MRRRLRQFAVLLVVAGVLSVAVHSGAFSQVLAGREVSASVAPDPSAYLAVEDAYTQGQTVRNYFQFCFFGCFNISVDVPRTGASVENRYAEDYTALDARVLVVQGGSNDVLEVRNVPASLAVGGTDTVDLGCTGDVTERGTADVVLQVEAAGANIDVDRVRVTVESVSYRCNQQ